MGLSWGWWECVLLHILFLESKWIIGDWVQLALRVHELLQGLKFSFKLHLEELSWGMTSGYMLEIRFMIKSNYLQCVPKNSLIHNEKPRFVYLLKPSKH